MSKVLKFVLLVCICSIGIYLLLPSPGFPTPPPNVLLSNEPADTESVYRRAYYTDLSRQEIMDHYTSQFSHPLQFKINLPPEDAAMVIRDQTRSSYLEEIIHPWKESLYVNGFVPVLPADTIERNGKIYANKITVKLVPSHAISRLTVLGMTAVCVYLIFKEYA
jgi:hypothetical protein